MILAIDAGNTNIVLGCIDGEDIRLTCRVHTDREKTADEYAMIFLNLLSLNGIKPKSMDGAILSCVVSELTDALCRAVEQLVGRRPLVVGAGVKTGLNIKIENPAQLGADLVVDAVAAIAKYPKPIIIFDIGTANTMSVIDRQGQFLGGAIMPGPRLSANSLSDQTSQLPRIELDAPPRVISRNTIQCIQSGVTYGHAAMIDGLIDRVEEELGEAAAAVVATGGQFSTIAPYCRRKLIQDDTLMLDGLRILYEKNRK